MPSRKRAEDPRRALCAQPHPDDGVDPREDKRRDVEVEKRSDRKTRQLCKQVAQTLQLALASLPQADVFAGADVREVTPAPNAGRLRALIVVAEPARAEEVAAVVQLHSVRLRREVAAAITRRRAPELTFAVVAEGGARG